MRRRDFVATAVAAASLGAAGCARSRSSKAVHSVTVSLSERLSSSPFYLADERGCFRDAGFHVSIVRISARDAIPTLAGGKLDVAFGGVAASFMNAAAKGARIRVVAGREYVNPGCGESFTLYAHRAVFRGGAIDPRRLRGRRVSVRLRGISEFILDIFLKQFGIAHGEVETVDLPLNEAVAALAGHRIDALVDVEFALSPLAVSPDIVKVWRLADVLPGHQYSFVLFGQSMLRDVEGGARFLAAYLEGCRMFLAGETPAFMREFAATYGLNVQQTVSACRETFSKDGSIDLASLRRAVDWNVERGYAAKSVTAESLVDTRFLDEARRLLASGRWRMTGRGTAGRT